MNKLYSDINDAVHLYVTRKMSDAEAEQFETYFLSEPEVIEMIEEAQLIRSGLNEVTEVGSNEPASQSFSARWSNFWTIFRIPIPAYAALACTAMIVSVTSYVVSDHYSDRQPSFVAFGGEIERSGNQSVVMFKELDINLSEHKSPTIIQFKIHKPSTEFFRVYLYDDQHNQQIWSSQRFKLGNVREHSVRLPDNINGRVVFSIVSVTNDDIEAKVNFCNITSSCR